MILSAFLLALTLSSPTTLVDDDVLEPSLQNEVDHALARVPTNLLDRAAAERLRYASVTNDFFGTNGLTRTETALKLVSAQQADGRWRLGTNDVTSVAREILKAL